MFTEERVNHFAAVLFSLGSGCFVQDTAQRQLLMEVIFALQTTHLP